MFQTKKGRINHVNLFALGTNGVSAYGGTDRYAVWNSCIVIASSVVA